MPARPSARSPARLPVRVADEPAFVLHRYDWSESSLILDVFTRHHGRVALVAKGAKRPSSQLRPVLLPLQPLMLSWGGTADVRTLKTAHWRGGYVMPVGDALLAGTYFNEMLLRMLARDDPHPTLFDGYAQAVAELARQTVPDAACLRAFELLLLREAGYLPALDTEGASLSPLADAERYTLDAEGGLTRIDRDAQRPSLTGQQWLALHHTLHHTPQPASLRAAGSDGADGGLLALAQVCRPCLAALQPQLRVLLHYHCGVRTFKTRQMMLDVQALVRRVAP